MSPIEKPTGQQLCDCWMEEGTEDFEFITEEMDYDDHGYAYTRIFKRLSDETYWAVYGVSQSGGDYDSLRDDPKTTTVRQVRPKQVMATEWVSV